MHTLRVPLSVPFANPPEGWVVAIAVGANAAVVATTNSGMAVRGFSLHAKGVDRITRFVGRHVRSGGIAMIASGDAWIGPYLGLRKRGLPTILINPYSDLIDPDSDLLDQARTLLKALRGRHLAAMDLLQEQEAEFLIEDFKEQSRKQFSHRVSMAGLGVGIATGVLLLLHSRLAKRGACRVFGPSLH